MGQNVDSGAKEVQLDCNKGLPGSRKERTDQEEGEEKKEEKNEEERSTKEGDQGDGAAAAEGGKKASLVQCVWGNTLGTQGSPDQTEGQGEADEGPVPLVVLPDGGHAHEDEDEGLADAAQHLHEVLDGRVGCLGHVFFHVLLHCHCACGDSAKKAESQGEAQGFALPQAHLRGGATNAQALFLSRENSSTLPLAAAPPQVFFLPSPSPRVGTG